MSIATNTLSPTIKADFDRDGFVALQGFFSADETDAIRREVERYIRDVGQGLEPGEMMYEDKHRPETLKQMARIAQHDAHFRALLDEGKTTQLAETLLGTAVVGRELEWFNKVPRESQETPPHQDGYYFMLEPPEALTMWLALDAVDEQNGCLRYVRGSHRQGLRPHVRSDILGFSQGIPDYGPADVASEVAVSAQPGDVLVHHCLTVHSAHANKSPDRHRRSLGMIYYAARAKADAVRLRAYQQRLVADWKQSQKI